MRYYNGNFISATDQDPSSSAVNGIFNLEAHLVHVKAGRWMQTAPPPSSNDPSLTAAEHYYDQGSSPSGYSVERNMNSDTDANELWSDIPVVTTSGKRLFVIIATYRDGSGGSAHWSSHFSSGSLLVTLDLKYNTTTQALTYRGSYAASKYNATSIWTAIADGAAAATDDYSILFTESTSNAHGNFSFSGIVVDNVDNVEYVNIESLGYSEGVSQNVTTALNLAPDNTTSATHVLRIAASNGSNISTDTLDYNKGSSEPAYTQIGEGDNGTNERHHHSYHFGAHGTQVNMTGTFGDSTNGANDGMSGLGCIIGLS